MQLGRGKSSRLWGQVRETGEVRRRHQSLLTRSDSTFQLVIPMVREWEGLGIKKPMTQFAILILSSHL